MLFQKVKVKLRCEKVNGILRYENKKERMRSLKKSLFSPIGRGRLSEKVSFCIFFQSMRNASLAVETALVLPLFFFGLVTLISFMDIYKLQTEHLTALCQRAKEAGMYAYIPDEKGPEEITLPDIYTYEPVGGLTPLPKIWMHNSVRVHTWTGREAVDISGLGEQELPEKMVYVTESGSVYHRRLSCSYLNLSVEQVSGASVKNRKNKYGETYEACEICSRNQKPAGVVFITGKSNRYHNSGSCSGLKRTVRMVKESEAEGMGACGRCG